MSTTATTVEPAAAAATSRGRLSASGAAAVSSPGPRLELVLLQVDRERARDRGDDGDHRAAATRPQPSPSVPHRPVRSPRSARRRTRSRTRRRRRSGRRRSAAPGSPRACRRRDRRALRAVRDDHLADTQRADVADHLRFLLGELQHPDVAQQVAVEVVVQLQRADLRHAHEPLPVVGDAAAARERGQGRDRELVARERRHVRPTRRVERREVGRAPGIAERVDAHLAPVAVVGERERRGRLARDEADGSPEPHERRQQLVAVARGTTRDHARGHPQPLQCTRTVVGAAADPWSGARQDVEREVPDQRDHALASMGLLESARARAASPNATRKLGSDAPPHGSACGLVCATRLVHHDGPWG